MAKAEIQCTLASGSVVTLGITNTEDDDVTEDPTWFDVFSKIAGK